ncbi:hypothetical protein [Bradyrhizobium acaciae]|uniref:hypothetical protein n=1 Tax=Bradyrhizobium acaciae TaxID=2683706 RepID=UPI001E41139E|nr:hypothetical protein [Bradyrhizobium acaciae]
MPRILLTALSSVLISTALVQFATAAERHRINPHRSVTTQAEAPARNLDAYAAWPRATPEGYEGTSSYYRGGYSAPAGH